MTYADQYHLSLTYHWVTTPEVEAVCLSPSRPNECYRFGLAVLLDEFLRRMAVQECPVVFISCDKEQAQIYSKLWFFVVTESSVHANVLKTLKTTEGDVLMMRYMEDYLQVRPKLLTFDANVKLGDGQLLLQKRMQEFKEGEQFTGLVASIKEDLKKAFKNGEHGSTCASS